METVDRQKLAAQIERIDQEYDEIKRAALAPVQDSLDALAAAKEGFEEQLGDEALGKCMTCDKYLFEGDKGYAYADEGHECEEHAPTWANIKETLEADGFEDDAVEAVRALVEAHEADGTLDQKCLYTL
jgi:hypothetical protein